MRGTSTVLDASLFLLLVSAAILTLASAGRPVPPADRSDPADGIAATLATSTAEVNYSLVPPRDNDENVAFPRTAGPGFRRTAHGTVASLLADATIARATVDGGRVSTAGTGFVRRVRTVTRTRSRRPQVATAVHVGWAPYPGAPIAGALNVGETPPPDADVHAATLRVASGVPPARSRAVRAAKGRGYRAVATVVARSIVAGLLPPDRSRLALRSGYPDDALTAYRYRRVATLLGVPSPGVGEHSTRAMNRYLSEALAASLATDMRTQYDSPTAAARDVRTATVTITVRTWSA